MEQKMIAATNSFPTEEVKMFTCVGLAMCALRPSRGEVPVTAYCNKDFGNRSQSFAWQTVGWMYWVRASYRDDEKFLTLSH